MLAFSPLWMCCMYIDDIHCSHTNSVLVPNVYTTRYITSDHQNWLACLTHTHIYMYIYIIYICTYRHDFFYFTQTHT